MACDANINDTLNPIQLAQLKLDASRYHWLREHLEFVRFEGGNILFEGHSGMLTSDTCDVGLDYAIDRRIDSEKKGPR